MKARLVILVSSLALGCAEQREYTFTEIKSVPKTSKKVVSKSKTKAVVNKDGKRTDNQILVYDVGTTIDGNGDLVGPHKVYRVVETSHWILGKPRIIEPKTFVKKDSPKDELDKAVAEVKEARDEVKSIRDSVQTTVSQQKADPTPSDDIRDQVENKMNGMSFPTPTPDVDQEALKKFTKSTADPNNP